LRSDLDDSGIFWVVENPGSVRKYDLYKKELGPEICTITNPKEKPKAIDSTKKYLWVIDQAIERVVRIDKETGEKKEIHEGMSQVYMCYTMGCIRPSYETELMVVSTGFIGVHFYECDSAKKIFSYVDPEDQFYQQIFLRSADKMIIGSQKGVIKLIDVSNL